MTYCNNGLLMSSYYTHLCFVTSACWAGQSSLLFWVLFLHQLALLVGYQWKKMCTSVPLSWCRIITFGTWLDLRQSVTSFFVVERRWPFQSAQSCKSQARPCSGLGGLMLGSHFLWFPKFCGRAGWQDLGCTDHLPQTRHEQRPRCELEQGDVLCNRGSEETSLLKTDIKCLELLWNKFKGSTWFILN